MATARSIALDHLSAAVPLFPDLPIGAPATGGLSPRDATLARAIDSAVRRRWMTIEAILAPCLARDLASVEPAVRAGLMGGAAQLLLLHRVPDHAAIHETVEWAKRRIRPGAGGFVNAVLRRLAGLRDEAETLQAGRSDAPPERRDLLLEDGRTLRLPDVWLPEESVPRLAVATSHVPLLVGRWVQSLGMEATCRVCRRGIVPPAVILHGSAGSDLPPELRPHRRPGFFVFEGTDLAEVLRRGPGLWVQDPASAAVVASLAAGPVPAVVVDLCAGRGTKTRQMATQWPASRIIATDVDRQRLATLRHALAECPGVQPAEPAAVESMAAAAGGADLVLLDVPCSNSGVLSRRLEARYRFNLGRLRELVEMQRSIIERGRALLRPGGCLAYATCSLEPEENQEQWAWIESRLGLRRISAETVLPDGEPGADAATFTDGGAWAVFESRR